MPARMVTDGGLETDLIFHHGVDLPEFAAFPLLDDRGRARAARRLLRRRTPRSPRRPEPSCCSRAPTWRANPDWAALLGYDAADLRRVNRDAVTFLRELSARFANRRTTISGADRPAR